MKLYMNKELYSAEAEYNVEEKVFIVLRGSTVSPKVSVSEKWRGASSIKKLRDEYTKDNKVIRDVYFKSASTAANFVTGVSTNGLSAWKTEDGTPLKKTLED